MRSSGNFYLLSVTALLLLSYTLPTLAVSCNGDPALCSKKFNQVHFVTTHNAFSVGQGIAANQRNSITQQLNDGVRALMLDAHNSLNKTGQIELCHADCRLQDNGPLVTALQAINKWMTTNPNDVVVIFWENFAKIAPSVFQTAYQSSGIFPLVYTPKTQEWPTLQEMITAGTRLVNFIDTGADSTVEWLMPEYTYVWETPFEVSAVTPVTFTCTLDRPKVDASAAPAMYVMNHFVGQPISGNVYVPQPYSAETINSYDNIKSQVSSCGSQWGNTPNFIAVDFYQAGEVFKVVAELNGVPYVAKPSSTTTGTGGNVINNDAGLSKKGSGIMLVGTVVMTMLLGVAVL